MITMSPMARRTRRAGIAAAGSLALIAGLTACGTASNSAAGANAGGGTLIVSQTAGGVAADQVTVPFYLNGSKFSSKTPVDLDVYAGGDTAAKPVFEATVTPDKNGSYAQQVSAALTNSTYLATATVGGSVVSKQTFAVTGGKTGLTRVTWDKGGATMSPALANGNLYIAGGGSGGKVSTWPLGSLPQTFTGDAVTLDPASTWQPKMPDGVKMEQINFLDGNKQLLISKKSTNANITGGNSAWVYDLGSDSPGTNLIGNPEPAGNGYYAWGSAYAAGVAEYNKANFPAKEPTKVAIGDGGGVIQAANGRFYFGSLQSGCVYKEDKKGATAEVVYCIPNFGASNQNQSIYSLAEDGNGFVYAAYQGAEDNNTIILKIDTNGAGKDKVQALQVSGWARTVGLAVSKDGSKIYLDGTSMKEYHEKNTNSIIELDDPTWGTTEAPAANKADAVTTIPGTPWLLGMALDWNTNVLYIADNNGGFWIDYP